MLNELNDIYSTYQQVLVGLCVSGLVATVVFPFFVKMIFPFVDSIRSFWKSNCTFEKVIVSVFCIGLIQYGATKEFWHRVSNDGGDTGLSIVGIYTATSNDVQVISGVTVTNQLNMVAVKSLGSALPFTTDVSVRMSETNEWTKLTKVNPRHEMDSTTNMLVFSTAESYSSYQYWWAGTNLPPVIVVSSGISVTYYNETSTNVTINFTCEDANAKEFTVLNKLHTESTWNEVVVTSNKSVVIDGFFIGNDRDWKITSEYLEDGE